MQDKVAAVLIGMGSNIDAEKNLIMAAARLRTLFSDTQFSSVYQSAAIGMDGADFLNSCCLLQSDLSQNALRLQLKSLEDEQGRDRSLGSWKPRTLDLDLLIYHGQVVDDELYCYAHACVPAAELVELELPLSLQGKLTPVVLRL
ncbi:MAG: 2-amino-4-hydroxy-6-hydroxymethyldihydropteridine diphosphokinase [Mariprofundus sp.]|nr:2-amino-4-hydroxy-6-hydroxymethyldihydropteridine diphosphokinase [Mariprofundus sp.]